jgi:hypothetical protein
VSDILLGFEVGTGKEVRVPYAHTVVCGQTQASGKTTTLEGMLSRTGDPPRPALAFLTKRAESAFAEAHRIPPYFRDRADWQFVESILEAMMRERMKYQREWIIRVCQGATSLEQVAKNVDLALYGGGRGRKAATGYAAGMYLQLSEYFKLLMPELRRLKLNMATQGSKLTLDPGLNVMDLSEYSTEMQSLAIASAMEEIYRRRNVITVIPEAWEFLPQSRNTPVKMAGEALIRKGAAAQNFMWLDSQDITGVDKRVLKQVGVWILGVQREINEVEHTLSQMAVPKKQKPQPDQVMQLRRGQFFVCFEDVLKRVYVLPCWMPREVGYTIAHEANAPRADKLLRDFVAQYEPKRRLSAVTVDDDRDNAAARDKHEGSRAERSVPAQLSEEDENVDYKAEYENLLEEVKNLKQRLAQYEERAKPGRIMTSFAPPEAPSSNGDEVAMLLETKRPVIDVTKRRYVLEMNDEDQMGRLALLLSEGFFDSPKKSEHINEEFRARGWAAQTGRPSPKNLDLAKLAEYGFIRIVGQGSYQAVPGMKVNVKEVAAA